MEKQEKPSGFRALVERRWGQFAVLGVILVVIGGVLIATHFIKKQSGGVSVPAPGFALRDQNGHLTSLAQFRGKVVVLTFIDPECTQLCPLTTRSMVEALKILGPGAASQVQLLGINANPDETRVADVAAYTRQHELQGRWRFLTGSPKQLEKVWHAYHVYVEVAKKSDDVVHEAVVYVIGPHGYESNIYTTPMSYASVGNQARLLAGDIAHLLPGRSVALAVTGALQPHAEPPIKPDEAVTLTALGPKHQPVAVGGAHPHLLLFFAGWLGPGAALEKKLAALDGYAAEARRQKWPAPVAVDELPTEPSAAEARKALAPVAARLQTPVVEDGTGRLADGYEVRDLPWIVLSSASGKILWSHDGWLSARLISRQVRAALAAPGAHSAGKLQ